MTRQHNNVSDGHPTEPVDPRRELTEMLTLALIQLTSEKRGKADNAPWQAKSGYDPSVLDSLENTGLIKRRGNLLELTEQGAIIGTGTVLVVADALDRLTHQGAYHYDEPQPLDDIPLFDPLPYRTKDDRRAFLLRIDLDLEGLFPCWREVLVPATCSFLDLHIVIQRVFNWYDEHLFNFEMVARSTNVHMEEYAFQEPDDVFVPEGYALAEAREVLLGDVFPRSRTARYSYDYGDGWEHKVRLVKTLRDADVTAPQLMAGEGDAPPEDVGGPGGFEDFLATISDPFNEDCVDALKWAESQGYEPFDLVKKQQELTEHYEDDRQVWLNVLEKTVAPPRQTGPSLRFV